MSPLAITLALLPTTVWCLILASVRPEGLSLRWLVGGMILGAMLGGPVWLAETAVDVLATDERFWRDFVQQILGAACSEESLKFMAIGFVVWRAFCNGHHSTRAVVAISISVGIGFMTLENVVAVLASDAPMSRAIDRQLTILAGHGHYQTIMGVFLALMVRKRRPSWVIPALMVPLFLHGWGDLSEQLFIDEPDPGSREDSMLYFSWLLSIATTAFAGFGSLWWVRKPMTGELAPQQDG